METIKEYISMYLPTITSVAAMFVSIGTFFKKVKDIVANTKNETKELKSALKNASILNQEYKDIMTEAIKKLQDKTAELETTNKTLATENKTLKDVVDSSLKTIELVQHLSLQVKTLEKEIEAAEGSEK